MESNFIWYELLSSDPHAAATFYGAVLGWETADSGQAGMDYRFFSKDGVAVGGLMALPPGAAEAGMRPGWLGYVSVADVDRAVGSFIATGGALHMPAMDVPGIGRMAMVADPQGAALYVMTPIGTDAATSFAPGKPGHGGWHELHARDWPTALAFYNRQFGWGEAGRMDMGPLGTYLQFNYGSGAMVGGMMNDPAAARPYWLYCFNVEDIDAATARIVASGGKVLMNPHEVPGGEWVARAQDPQGALFVAVGPRK